MADRVLTVAYKVACRFHQWQNHEAFQPRRSKSCSFLCVSRIMSCGDSGNNLPHCAIELRMPPPRANVVDLNWHGLICCGESVPSLYRTIGQRRVDT